MSQTENIIFKHNDFEGEFDVLDADSAELLEKSMAQLREDEKDLPKTGSISDIVRSQCKWLRDFFDRIFGEGAGVKICGARDNFHICRDAYVTFLDFVEIQKQDYVNSTNAVRSKYSANRAQRRHPATAPNGKGKK